jgi:hypothetical protein
MKLHRNTLSLRTDHAAARRQLAALSKSEA